MSNDKEPHYWEHLYTKITPAITKMMQDLDADILRADGRIEKSCEHGVGHTVGHVNPELMKDKYMWIHGCDNCCQNFKRQPGPEETKDGNDNN